MAERRRLIEGIRTRPTEEELAFIKGTPPTSAPTSDVAPKPVTPAHPPLHRAPFSNRMRTDYIAALKRASLERQLTGIEPHSVQDILEQAMEQWLKSNGYLAS